MKETRTITSVGIAIVYCPHIGLMENIWTLEQGYLLIAWTISLVKPAKQV